MQCRPTPSVQPLQDFLCCFISTPIGIYGLLIRNRVNRKVLLYAEMLSSSSDFLYKCKDIVTDTFV